MVKGEGKGQIVAKNNSKLLGSVNVDRDSLGKHPQANRWDYAIGCERGGKAVVFYVEVHSAGSHGVREVEKKLDWLEGFLNEQSKASLRKLACEYHWVASGEIRIPKHVPQYRRLLRLRSRRELRGPVKHLELS